MTLNREHDKIKTDIYLTLINVAVRFYYGEEVGT
ncbi:hypothetical protein SAMN05518848_108206 [Paenibacillus sp. PDC88]|nr:hypothetical protein SAMN05518848_108206 [Paenibacillus sp. PDC88]